MNGGKKKQETNVQEEGGWKKVATDVLEYVNKVTGRKFRPTEANLRGIVARLKEGYTIEDAKLVVDFKWAEWGEDEKMRQYVNPVTLFRPSHFDRYLQAARAWDERGRPSLNGRRRVLRNVLLEDEERSWEAFRARHGFDPREKKKEEPERDEVWESVMRRVIRADGSSGGGGA